jgi:hypothetical protein
MTRKRLVQRAVALTGLTLVAACSSTPAPPPSIAPDAERTVDGLYLVDNSAFQLAYTKQDLDLSPYTAFMLDEVEVAYQKDPQGRRSNSPDANFALSPTQMQNLKDNFREQLVTALTEDDGYDLVDTPGPNVAELDAYLINLVVRFPTERMGGRDDSYVSSYGEVTMVLEIRDSQSGEVLARVAERADPTSSTYRLAEVNPTFVRSDVTQLFRHWAGKTRERLDAVRNTATGN